MKIDVMIFGLLLLWSSAVGMIINLQTIQSYLILYSLALLGLIGILCMLVVLFKEDKKLVLKS